MSDLSVGVEGSDLFALPRNRLFGLSVRVGRLFYHSTQGLRVVKKKNEVGGGGWR